MNGSARHSLSRRGALAGGLAGGLALAACGRAPVVEPAQVFPRGRFLIVDGQALRLVDLHIPDADAPFGAEAGTMMERVAREVDTVEWLGTPSPGRSAPARVFGRDGTDLADALVLGGFARLWPRGEGDRDLQAAFALEDEARRRGRGLWAHGAYAAREPAADALLQEMDSFQLVRGLVVDDAPVGKWRYLNFGADWRSDFTVATPRKLLPEESLAGARVEARGWIESRNGPIIWLEDARALRVLD